MSTCSSSASEPPNQAPPTASRSSDLSVSSGRSTKEVFLKRPKDLDGDSSIVRDITQLSLQSPQMVLRKNMLTHWLAKVLASDFDKMDVWEFMDRVGVMHTGQPAFKHRLK